MRMLLVLSVPLLLTAKVEDTQFISSYRVEICILAPEMVFSKLMKVEIK